MRTPCLSFVLATCLVTSIPAWAQGSDREAVVLDTLAFHHESPILHVDLLIGRNEQEGAVRRLLRARAATLAPSDSSQRVDLFRTVEAFQLHTRTHRLQLQHRLRRHEAYRINKIGYAASLEWFKPRDARPRIVWQELFEDLPAEIIE